MRILDRYILKQLVASTLFVSLVLISIQSFLSLIQEMHFIGKGHYGLSEVITYSAMQLPVGFYQLFPMGLFLGCLVGLGRLATASELIVMRAAGVSVLRIAFSVIKAAVLIILLVTIVGEGFGPYLQKTSNVMRTAWLSTEKPSAVVKNIWLRQGDRYIYVEQIDNNQTIQGVVEYLFHASGRLKQITTAKTGVLRHGQWMLKDLSIVTFHRNHVVREKRQEGMIHLLLRPNLQVKLQNAPAQDSLWTLYDTILYRHSVGLSVTQQVYAFWSRAIQPVTTLVMVLLAVPFVFGSLRSASTGHRVLLGIVIGFSFYMLNQLFGPIALVYQYPAVLAAATPTLIFLGVLVLLLFRVK